MYSSAYPDCTRRHALTKKVDTVCERVLDVCASNEQKYILPIIQCLIKSSKHDLEEALTKILGLRGEYSDDKERPVSYA